MDIARHLARSHDIATKVEFLFQKRSRVAQALFQQRAEQALKSAGESLRSTLVTPDGMQSSFCYAVDLMQRSILFWDTLRERGNN